MYDKFTHTSLEYRTTRAILTSTFTKNELNDNGYRMCNETFAAGNKDWNKLKECGHLEKVVGTRARYDIDVVKDAVEFILSPDNVGYSSWGKKTVMGIKLPAYSLIGDKAALWRKYETRMKDADGVSKKKVSKTKFYEMVGLLTVGGMKARKSVNYVVSTLVSEVFHTTRRLIRDLVDSTVDKDLKLTEESGLIEKWLKYQYKTHVGKDGCKSHCTAHALNEPPLKDAPVPIMNCNDCKVPFAFIDKLLDIDSVKENESACIFLEEAKNKFALFYGYQQRVKVQENAIRALDKIMIDECLESKITSKTVKVILDYKQKIEPMRNRETSIQNYGKRGISFHGVMLIWYEYIPEYTTSGGAHFPAKAVQKIQYYDQISKRGSNRSVFV